MERARAMEVGGEGGAGEEAGGAAEAEAKEKEVTVEMEVMEMEMKGLEMELGRVAGEAAKWRERAVQMKALLKEKEEGSYRPKAEELIRSKVGSPTPRVDRTPMLSLSLLLAPAFGGDGVQAEKSSREWCVSLGRAASFDEGARLGT